jgi:hypothetical protein
VRQRLLFAGCAAIAATIIGGCSNSLVATDTEPRTALSAGTARAAPVHAADNAPVSAIAKSMANVALVDHDLSQIRGGLSVGSGIVVNFAFQESTYVNGNLTQNIVIPTITVSPGSGTATVAGNTISGAVSGFSPNSVATLSNSVAQVATNSPSQAIQSIVNNGMTSIVSNLSGGSVSSVISNGANNQLVQQLVNANIGVAGLSNTIQQSVASTVLGRVQAATSQFR